jgi:NADPH-dependent curcumin reductase CurA
LPDRQNRRIALVRRPQGMPTEDCFRLEEAPSAELGEGQVRVESAFLSIDAFIRTTLNEDSYHPSVPIGGTVSAMGVGRVLESSASGFAPGDAVVGPLGAQTLAAVPAGLLQKVDAERAPISAYLGALGLTAGLTAYFGIREVGAVRSGETVLVSAAAGAVGSMACQIARLDGARVIGTAGGPEKVGYLLDELRVDGAIDYRVEDVAARLRTLAPDGIDVFFDNVGGSLLDVALDQIRERGRVVICGAISQYQNMDAVQGPGLYLRLAERHARMEGFAVNHFRARFPEASAQLASWLDAGEIGLHEQIEQGIERFPQALLELFDGGHVGKLLVAI